MWRAYQWLKYVFRNYEGKIWDSRDGFWGLIDDALWELEWQLHFIIKDIVEFFEKLGG